MAFKKLGKIFKVDNNFPWLKTHTANPFAVSKHGHVLVYFSGRDEKGRSSVGTLKLEIEGEEFSTTLLDQQVLAPGDRGTFDESGISVGCVLNHKGKYYLYYLGWELGQTVPFKNTIGLAIGDSSSFTRVSKAPIFGRHHHDPFTLSYPAVIYDQGVFRMWYGSHTIWKEGWQEMEHVIKYAESSDGINWNREGLVCIDLQQEGEWGISRPSVIKDSDCYRMWYSFVKKDQAYRIGYAESADGLTWERKDYQVGLDVSPGEFDSDMLCYPNVFDYQGRRYLLYSGDGYGKEGLGIAVLE